MEFEMFVNKKNFLHDDLITGEKFTSICDRVFFHYKDVDTSPIKPYETILYTDTHKLEDLLSIIPRNRNIVLVTHNSDRNVYDEIIPSIPDNVVWFSQNVCTKIPKVSPIPIGLENNRWFPEVNKKGKLLERNHSNDLPSKLLYVNHAIWTNPGERQIVYDRLRNKDWVTCVENSKNGTNFDSYLNDIADHFYVASPNGNGSDCHRTWEVLYSNRVPVVTRKNNSMFDGLPVLMIDSWDEVTEDYLRSKMQYFTSTVFNGFDKLTFSYWELKIKGY